MSPETLGLASMTSSRRHSTANPVTVILAVQLFIIGAGYVLTRLFVHQWNKLCGPDGGPVEIRWGRLVAQYGLWSLLLPIAWGAWTAIQANAGSGRGSVSRRQLTVGLAGTMFLLLTYGWTIGGVLVALGHP